jgi:hypothetical protein
MADGLQNVGVQDPATGASSTMTNALTYGAGPGDTIKLIQGSNPATPMGGQAPNPIRVQVLAPDGTTPVAGASVFFISTPAASLSACGGAGSCTVLTDDSGQASTRVTVLQAAVINVSVLLAPASYLTPKSVQATILGTTSSLDLSLLSPSTWVEQGATVDIALSARMLSGGEPIRNGTVNYQVVKGSGTLASASGISDVNGFANTTLHLASIGGDVQVSACVAPANLPCQLFSATAVPPSMLRLEPVSGSVQVLPTGQNFQPITVGVTDSAIPTHPVLGASVTFQVVVSRPAIAPPPISIGGIVVGQNPAPVVVSSSQVAVLSDGSGLATLQPPSGGDRGALIVQGTASAGSGLVPFQLQSLAPVPPSASSGLRRPAGNASDSDRDQPATSR